MSYGEFKPYVPVAARAKKVERAIAKANKAGAPLAPIAAYRGAIAKTFWGKAWCDNLERYSDFANRLPRGRTYVRGGAVIDLVVAPGEVRAQVMGSSVYTVGMSVAAVPNKQWQSIGADCSGSIDTLVELLQGKLSKAVMERICRQRTGLFPSPQELKFECSCPDWAVMCKHVAAVLYGIGARLDQQPELLFALRKVDVKELVGQAGAGLALPARRPARGKVLDDALLGDVFGIEMAAPAVPKPRKPSPPPRKPPAPAKRAKIEPAKAKPAKTTQAAGKRPSTKPTARQPAPKTNKASTAKATSKRARKAAKSPVAGKRGGDRKSVHDKKASAQITRV